MRVIHVHTHMYKHIHTSGEGGMRTYVNLIYADKTKSRRRRKKKAIFDDLCNPARVAFKGIYFYENPTPFCSSSQVISTTTCPIGIPRVIFRRHFRRASREISVSNSPKVRSIVQPAKKKKKKRNEASGFRAGCSFMQIRQPSLLHPPSTSSQCHSRIFSYPFCLASIPARARVYH